MKTKEKQVLIISPSKLIEHLIDISNASVSRLVLLGVMYWAFDN